jgi:hypothetical protein
MQEEEFEDVDEAALSVYRFSLYVPELDLQYPFRMNSTLKTS